MNEDLAWQEAKNILCLRLDTLGDVLMTTPALRAIKEGRPDRRITLLTSAVGAKITPLIPEVDDTLIYEAPWMKATAPRLSPQPDLQFIEALRCSRFDAAVIFTVFSQNPLPGAMLTYLAGIPLRLAHCRENPYQLLTHWVPETDHFAQAHIRHEVQRQLDLVTTVGFHTQNEHLSLAVSEAAKRTMRKKLTAIGLDITKRWLVIHPGASAASRRYPAESFALVAEQLANIYGFQVLFTGIRSEKKLIESIQRNMQAVSFSLAGLLKIKEFAALLSLAPVLLSNNTGPVHIAAAVGTPVVDLYALTNPQHTPWKVPHRTLSYDVSCKYCYKSVCPMKHHHCLQLITPESVVEALLDLYEETQSLMTEKTELRV
jgi:lipopolysaccharide heptosyltransferase II